MTTQYTATISFFSRGNCRGGHQWSTKRLNAGLAALGYTMEPKYPGYTLVQMVTFTGTREQVVKQRRSITHYLKRTTGNKIALRFELI